MITYSKGKKFNILLNVQIKPINKDNNELCVSHSILIFKFGFHIIPAFSSNCYETTIVVNSDSLQSCEISLSAHIFLS